MAKTGITIFCVLMCAWVIDSSNGFTVNDVSTFPGPVDGLSWFFYTRSCPGLEFIVRERVNFYLKQDITQAAGLLRVLFHDCFVEGCDASVLLSGSTSGPGEQEAPPNLTLREKAFKIIDDIKNSVENACKGVVSCADIVTLATRDAIAKAGGPFYPVPLGRRDSLHFANLSTTLANLPPPTSDVTRLMSVLGPKGFSLTDLVALSGGHTIGIGHCSSFSNRLYDSDGNTVTDSTLEQSYANNLYATCPTRNSSNTTNLDVRTPNLFDNQYFVDLQNGQTLFSSDQTLYTNSTTRGIVDSFASNQTLFFQNFVIGMLKMSQLNVLTGSQGEIRANCSTQNPTSSYNIHDEFIGSVAVSELSSHASI
eukprot:Gb_37315 [translate_table: standard]